MTKSTYGLWLCRSLNGFPTPESLLNSPFDIDSWIKSSTKRSMPYLKICYIDQFCYFTTVRVCFWLFSLMNNFYQTFVYFWISNSKFEKLIFMDTSADIFLESLTWFLCRVLTIFSSWEHVLLLLLSQHDAWINFAMLL